MKLKFLSLFTFTLFLLQHTLARQLTAPPLAGLPQYITTVAAKKSFKIAANKVTARIYVDPQDWEGVIRGANDLSADIDRVTGLKAAVYSQVNPVIKSILIGTIGKSRIIDKLIAQKKLNVSAVKGKWESFVIQTIGGDLVIAGSDKRGTLYGIYDISEKIGVSPWYWWADVPVKKSSALFLKAGRYVQQSPKVKYRGIFINDEWPSMGGWTSTKFGGFNSKMYENMFELLLRLKANYLWPAMWSAAFHSDDPDNFILADKMGIVIGTSHHEPMARPHQEWVKNKSKYGNGEWNFETNKAGIEQFFEEGIERIKTKEEIITIGMRGDGDVAMGSGDDQANIKTLRHVVSAQRNIIGQVYGKNPAEVPQLWAVFTEVQRYYDAGLNVPEDVILLLCDNNWGYIRRTGPEQEKKRSGGLGLYYHIDMNGGPWNDRWVNTTTIPKLREQFNLAYQTGIDKLWVVNVGDLKPKELPIDFIMRYAWNPEALPADKVMDYTTSWAAQNFGPSYATEIGGIVSDYSKYNLYRKPEVQSTKIFSVVNYHEADLEVKKWRALTRKAEELALKISPQYQDAYDQLVRYPTKASAGVAEIYLAAAKNNLYAKQGRVTANDYALRVRELFALDSLLSENYNKRISKGKWDKMMSDKHIGYSMWSMPKENKYPELVMVKPLSKASMGIAIEGCENAWPGNERAVLPVFDRLLKQSYYIDIFNKGTGVFSFTATPDMDWIKLSETKGSVATERRIQVELDWDSMSIGTAKGKITIKSGQDSVTVGVEAINARLPVITEPYFGNFSGSEFSIPAPLFNRNVPGSKARWVLLPDLGRAEGNMGIYPVTAPSVKASEAPYLEYKVFINNTGKVRICLGILPTQDINPARGLRIAAGLNDQQAIVLDARKGFADTFSEYTPENLSRSKTLKAIQPANPGIKLISNGPRRNEIFDNLRWLDFELNVERAGLQNLRIYMVDPEIVLEQIVVNPDNRFPSYFGAPVMQHIPKKKK
ncbi:hypothetical protein FFJ24_001025 [Pedobacter sp. KBS0701]|uniref:glycosyl hydrolase 115 family protein n=1 Tax=Pedobacter sp. KBS0701 TaxID=2578106 RepID=UPI00110DCE1E|nr:glycosyl hydrolase 115 family protein [Pedobacter sp. KBS0701]QDW23484.1 hypothetical protein FFJ24_001025 [Pedobacter sp. KBS0701]